MSRSGEAPLVAHCADDPYVQVTKGYVEIVLPARAETPTSCGSPEQIVRLPHCRNARELAYMLGEAADELERVPIAERGWGPRV